MIQFYNMGSMLSLFYSHQSVIEASQTTMPRTLNFVLFRKSEDFSIVISDDLSKAIIVMRLPRLSDGRINGDF